MKKVPKCAYFFAALLILACGIATAPIESPVALVTRQPEVTARVIPSSQPPTNETFQVVVRTDVLNVRLGAGTEFGIAGQLIAGDEVQVSKHYENGSFDGWYFILSGEFRGMYAYSGCFDVNPYNLGCSRK